MNVAGVLLFFVVFPGQPVLTSLTKFEVRETTSLGNLNAPSIPFRDLHEAFLNKL